MPDNPPMYATKYSLTESKDCFFLEFYCDNPFSKTQVTLCSLVLPHDLAKLLNRTLTQKMDKRSPDK